MGISRHILSAGATIFRGADCLTLPAGISPSLPPLPIAKNLIAKIPARCYKSVLPHRGYYARQDLSMTIEKILLSLFPIPLFYLIYLRYFRLKSDLIEHIQSFLSGTILALILILAAPVLSQLFLVIGLGYSPLVEGFIKAAVVEKLGAFAIILVLLRRHPDFTVIQAALSAMTFGIGFALVENVFYAMTYGYGIILIRVIYTVPLHLTTCGIMGYYMGMRKFCDTGGYRVFYAAKALFYPVVLHGAFDALLISGGRASYLSAPLLILMVVVLEYLLAKAQGFIPHAMLQALRIRFEEWLAIYRQPRFDRWILQSMGMPEISPVHLFLWRPGFVRFFFVVLFMFVALAGLSYRDEIIGALEVVIKKEEEIMILGVFPSSISLILIMVGAINPRFFKESEVKIPIISDVEVSRSGSVDETMVTYDISAVNCFLKTSEPMGLGTEISARFVFTGFSSPEVTCRVVWENHEDRQEPLGSVVIVEKRNWRFRLFYLKYLLYRYRKGLVFNLKLPGFETTRRLFMRPITTMQTERIYQRADKIFNEGERGDEFYLIKKGRVLFYKTTSNEGEIITMESIGPGQIFGEMSIVHEAGRATTAICLTDCIVAVAKKNNMDALIRHNPDFALTLIRTLTERLQMSEKIMLGNIKGLQGEAMERREVFRVAAILAMLGRDGSIHATADVEVDRVIEFVRGLTRAEEDGTLIDKLLVSNNDGTPVTGAELTAALLSLRDRYLQNAEGPPRHEPAADRS